MAIAFGSAGTQYLAATAATSHAVPYPSGIAADDLLVLFIATNGGAVTSPSSPWVEVHREGTLSNPKGGLWIKVATGSESGTLDVTTSSTTASMIIFRYTGVDPTTPQDATATTVLNTVSTVSSVLPSINTNTADAWLVYCNAGNSSSTTVSSTTGTQRINNTDPGGTGDKTGGLFDEALGAAGATGTRTIDLSASRANWGAMMALRPAGGGGTPGDVTAVTATGTCAAIPPFVQGSGPVNVVAVTATATAMLNAPAVVGDPVPGNVAAVTATATALAPAPAVNDGTPNPILNRYVQDIPGVTTMAVMINTTNATSVRLKCGTDSSLTAGVVYGAAQTPDGLDNAQVTVTGLTAGTRYYARVAMTKASGIESLDDWSTIGEFVTDTSGAQNFTFAFGSCNTQTDSPAYGAVATKKPDLFLHLGDEYYSDGSGTDLANFRSKMNLKKTATNQKAIYRTSGSSLAMSDHDGMNNDGNAGSDPTGWANYNTVYREFNPTTDLPTGGIYRSMKRGRVRIIRLDRRSFATIPSATDDASKTCLGATQKQWLKDEITNATEPVILIQQGEPWIENASAGDDAWAGYTTERTELSDFFIASGKHIAMLAGDMHALAAEDGSGSPGKVAVFHAAPFHTTSSSKGGPYDVGPYPASGIASTQQYGWMDVTDTGSTITFVFRGFSADDVERVTLTKVYVDPVAAPDSTATATAHVPTVVGGGSGAGDVAAVVATATATALVPTVLGAATVAGVLAAATAIANAPTVEGAQTATVVAVNATATALAVAPAVQGAQTATVTGVTATATAQFVPPGIAAQVTAATALATALAPAPAVLGAATISGVQAAANSLAAPPVVTAQAIVTSVASTATALAVAPSVAISPSIDAVPATATAAATAPSVTALVVVTAVPATATAAAVSPAVSAGGAANVSAVTATATAAGIAPVFATPGDIAAVPAQATSLAIAPAVGVATTVVAVAATATGSAIAPTLQYGATITAVTAAATAQMTAPFVAGGGAVTVSAVPATAVASSAAPAVSIPAGITSVTATAAAATAVPTVSAEVSVTGVRAQATAAAQAPVASVEVVIAVLVVTATALLRTPTMSGQASLVAAVALASALMREPIVGVGSQTYLKDGTRVQAFRVVGGILVPVEVIY